MKFLTQLAVTSCVAMLTLPGVVMAQELKIGVVNFERLAAESPQFTDARAKLEDEFAPKARELTTRQNALKEKAERLQKDIEVMAVDERAAAERELSNEQRSIVRDQQALQEESEIRQRELLGPVQQQLIAEVQKFGVAGGYDMIMAEGIVFASERIDVTNAILAKLQAAESAQ